MYTRLVNLLVCDFVSGSTRFLSNRGCCRCQTWICGYVQRALGTSRVWSGVVHTRCALIRDRQPTAWDDFARSAEAEATCIPKVSHQIVVERFQYYKCQVRGSFCEISEEYDVKLYYTVVAS